MRAYMVSYYFMYFRPDFYNHFINNKFEKGKNKVR